MAHLHVAVDGRVMFDADVPGWNPPPDLPANPVGVGIQGLPGHVRAALAKAMERMLESKIGFKQVRIEP